MWQQPWMRAYWLRWKRWGQTPLLLRLAQQAKLRKLLQVLVQRVAYYNEMRNLRFEHFPIMDKGVVQDNFQRLNVFNWSLEQAVTMARTHPQFVQMQGSAGTGGKPGCYLYFQKEIQMAVADLLSKITIKPYEKVAIFHLAPQSSIPPVTPRWHFFSLQQPIREQLSRLQRLKPTVLIAPAQTLLILAHWQQVHHLDFQVNRLIATSEVLTPIEEEFIVAQFKQRVDQLYQCAEGWLGVTCRYGSLHLNENLFLIEKEWIDSDRERFIPVITALTRFLQPLVRYRMEDILRLKPFCPCGSALTPVEKMIERCEDVLYFPARLHRHILKPVYFDHLQQAIAQAGKIQHFQIVQHSPTDIAIKLQAQDMPLSARVQEQLEALWHRQEVAAPCLAFTPLEERKGQMFKHTVRE